MFSGSFVDSVETMKKTHKNKQNKTKKSQITNMDRLQITNRLSSKLDLIVLNAVSLTKNDKYCLMAYLILCW